MEFVMSVLKSLLCVRYGLPPNFAGNIKRMFKMIGYQTIGYQAIH